MFAPPRTRSCVRVCRSYPNTPARLSAGPARGVFADAGQADVMRDRIVGGRPRPAQPRVHDLRQHPLGDGLILPLFQLLAGFRFQSLWPK